MEEGADGRRRRGRREARMGEANLDREQVCKAEQQEEEGMDGWREGGREREEGGERQGGGGREVGVGELRVLGYPPLPPGCTSAPEGVLERRRTGCGSGRGEGEGEEGGSRISSLSTAQVRLLLPLRPKVADAEGGGQKEGVSWGDYLGLWAWA